MMLMNKNRFKLMKVAYQICFLFGLSVGLVVFDTLPQYEQGKLTINHAVWAQNPSDSELQRYGAAATRIEELRRTTYNSIREIVGNSKSPALACNQQQNFNQLPNEARNMAIDYCEQSERIVEQNGLTINQFNQITRQLKQNPALYQRLQQLMD